MEPPLTVRLKIALEDSQAGRDGTVLDITKHPALKNLEMLFTPGADEVLLPFENGAYRKISDRVCLDLGLPVRELQYTQYTPK